MATAAPTPEYTMLLKIQRLNAPPSCVNRRVRFSHACGVSENQRPKVENSSPGDFVAAISTHTSGSRK